MKKMKILVLAFVFAAAGVLPAAAQETGGESGAVEFEWTYGYHGHFQGTRTFLTDDVFLKYIAFYYPEGWRLRDNDFEWPKIVETARADIRRQGEEALQTGRVYFIKALLDFKNYNFQRKGFMVDTIDEGIRYNAPGYDFPNVVLFLRDSELYNFFPMTEENAQVFLAERGAAPFYRNGRLMPEKQVFIKIYFSIEPFSGAYYNTILKADGTRNFFGLLWPPIPAKIIKMEVYDDRNIPEEEGGLRFMGLVTK